MYKLSQRSEQRLSRNGGVKPILIACSVLALKKYSKIDFGVDRKVVRTIQEQQEYFDKGSSRTMKSKHLPQEDGFSHAVDIYPSGYKNVKDIPKEAYEEVKRSMDLAANDLGLELIHGLDWGWDSPHHEIKKVL